jgi:four helix bundle protein
MPNELAEQLKERTLRFALRTMRLCRAFPREWDAQFVADQLFRAGARTGANYRAACRARSRKDFINKLEMAVEESDEGAFWLELAGRAGINKTAEQQELLQEAEELLAILNSSAKTASENLNHQ